MTTQFWLHIKKKDADKELDAKLLEHFKKEEVDWVNLTLADRLEEGGEEALEAYIDKRVSKEVDKRIANRKKEARRNTLGGAKTQEPQPTVNGPKSKKQSKEKNEQQQGNSHKRYSEDSNRNRDYEQDRHRSRSRHH